MADNIPDSEKKPIGRPTDYTPELVERICMLIATHPIGYDHIRAMYPDLPQRQALRVWRHKYPDFNSKYLDAKRFQAELMVEDIDEMLPDEIKVYFDKEGNERIDSPSAAMLIAKINNRKWMAARLAPKRFGDSGIAEDPDTNKETKEEMKAIRDDLDSKNQKEF